MPGAGAGITSDLDVDNFAAAVNAAGSGCTAVSLRRSATWSVCRTIIDAAQLTVWTCGEAELDIGRVSTAAVTSTHYQLSASMSSAAASTTAPAG